MSVEVKNLSFAYKRREVLKNVSFSANDGEFVALLGPNGAGKTTLFRCILGFLNGYSGSVLCDGADMKTASVRERGALLAYIPQSGMPIFNHTVIDTVLMGTTRHGSIFAVPGKKQLETAEGALEKLGITHLRERGISELSGGERQMVLIARAVAQGAKALIMDEPAASLDLGNRHCVLSLARTLAREGYTVLMSMHDPEQALVFADCAIMLRGGEIIANGMADDVITEKLIHKVYGIDVEISSSKGGKGILFKSPEEKL